MAVRLNWAGGAFPGGAGVPKRPPPSSSSRPSGGKSGVSLSSPKKFSIPKRISVTPSVPVYVPAPNNETVPEGVSPGSNSSGGGGGQTSSGGGRGSGGAAYQTPPSQTMDENGTPSMEINNGDLNVSSKPSYKWVLIGGAALLAYLLLRK